MNFLVIEVKKKEGESFESMYRRFSRRFQQSGIAIRFRKLQFFTRKKSKNLERRSALRRAELAEEREELKRQGKLPQPTRYTARRSS